MITMINNTLLLPPNLIPYPITKPTLKNHNTSIHSSLKPPTLSPKPKPKPPKTETKQNPKKIKPKFKTKTKTHFNQCTISNVLRLYDVLRLEVTPDMYTSFVEECTKRRDADEAVKLVKYMKRDRRIVEYLKGSNGLSLINRVLMMVVVCGRLDVAEKLFDEMPQRSLISLAILVGGFVNEGLDEGGLGFFVENYGRFDWGEVESEVGLRVVVGCVFEACGRVRGVRFGRAVHGWLIKMGYGRELFVGKGLIELYGKCRCLNEANAVFFDQVESVGCIDPSLWNRAIVNNCRELCGVEAVSIFKEMGRWGVRKNDHTFSSVLKGCGGLSDGGSSGKQVHANAVKLGLDTRVSVMCGLVDMYSRFGLMNDARKVFELIPTMERNLVCWRAMVSGFVNCEMPVEAMKIFYEMKAAGVQPDQSLIEVMTACV